MADWHNQAVVATLLLVEGPQFEYPQKIHFENTIFLKSQQWDSNPRPHLWTRF